MPHILRRAAAAGALCLGLAAASTPVLAQPPGGAQPAPREGGRERMIEDMKHRREQRLHDLLQIKPDQEAAFRTFLSSTESLRPGRQRRGDAPRPADPRALTTPERLDRMAQAMNERQQRFQRFAAAVKTFYGVLTPDQRKAFDALGPMARGRMHDHLMRRGPGPITMPMRPGGPEGPPPR